MVRVLHNEGYLKSLKLVTFITDTHSLDVVSSRKIASFEGRFGHEFNLAHRQLLSRLDLPRLGRSAGVVGDAGRTTYRLINKSQKEQHR